MADRATTAKEEPLVKSLYDRINAAKKDWINDIYMCDENEIQQTDIKNNNCIIVRSIENYKFKIEVDNDKNTAKIVESIKENGKVEFAILTFNVNAANGQGSMGTQRVQKQQNAKLSKNTFTREGYQFKEWNTSADGTGTPYQDEAEINVEEDITLYAIWTRIITKTYLYNEGQMHSEIGGIEQLAFSGYNSGTFTINPTRLSVRKNSANGEWKALYLFSKNKFDFTGFTKLYCSFSHTYLASAQAYTDGLVRTASVTFGISSSRTGDVDGVSNNPFDARSAMSSPSEHNAVSQGARTLEVDISGFDGFAYLKLWCHTNNWIGQRTDFDIDKIWVE